MNPLPCIPLVSPLSVSEGSPAAPVQPAGHFPSLPAPFAARLSLSETGIRFLAAAGESAPIQASCLPPLVAGCK